MADSRRIQVILPSELDEKLKLHALEQKRSVSAMGARIIEDYVDSLPVPAAGDDAILKSMKRLYGFDEETLEAIRRVI